MECATDHFSSSMSDFTTKYIAILHARVIAMLREKRAEAQEKGVRLLCWPQCQDDHVAMPTPIVVDASVTFDEKDRKGLVVDIPVAVSRADFEDTLKTAVSFIGADLLCQGTPYFRITEFTMTARALRGLCEIKVGWGALKKLPRQPDPTN